MHRIRLFALLLVAPLAAQAPGQHTLLPVPQTVTLTSARLRLDSATTVSITGYRDARLERGVQRALRRLEGRIALALPRNAGRDPSARLVVRVGGPGFGVPDLEEDESYQLNVDAERATLTAATVVGALRGLETLLQLQAADSAGFYLAGAGIVDAPRFRWRGMLLDVSRHFHPVPVVERVIDGMAALKMNVLHWHLSDDQGFRVESRRYPRLHQLGSDGDYYTQEQLRAVVAYAADRGVRVVPEFDVPGHTTAWLVGYPGIASAPGPYEIGRAWGVFRPVMDPTRPETYAFLESFIREMVTIFPDRYFHIGGDEVEPTAWKTSERIQAWMKQQKIPDEHGLQTAFNRRLFEILAKVKREPVGWDEILQPDLPAQGVIQAWTGSRKLIDAAQQGRRAFLSAPWYLDHINTAGQMYAADPLPEGHGLAPAQEALILGGEACMWAEYVTAETVESRIFLRLGAVAERLWSPASVRDVPDMYRRLEITSRRLEELGLRHEGHTAAMVRRFAAGADAALFERLLDFARPKGFGNYRTDQFSPHTRLLDAARPDPFTEARMVDAVARAQRGDPLAVDLLRNAFAGMVTLRASLDAVVPRIPIATEGLAVAAALRDAGRVGEEALGYLLRKERPGAAWKAGADSVIMRTRGRTFGLLRPVGIDAVRDLVAGVTKSP